MPRIGQLELLGADLVQRLVLEYQSLLRPCFTLFPSDCLDALTVGHGLELELEVAYVQAGGNVAALDELVGRETHIWSSVPCPEQQPETSKTALPSCLIRRFIMNSMCGHHWPPIAQQIMFTHLLCSNVPSSYRSLCSRGPLLPSLSRRPYSSR